MPSPSIVVRSAPDDIAFEVPDEMVQGGMMTLDKVRIIAYRAGGSR